MRLRGDTHGEKRRSQSIHVVGVWGVHAFSDFLRDLSPAGAQADSVSGARVDPAGLFYDFDFAHDPGGSDCAVDYRDTTTRVARAI